MKLLFVEYCLEGQSTSWHTAHPDFSLGLYGSLSSPLSFLCLSSQVGKLQADLLCVGRANARAERSLVGWGCHELRDS